MDTLGIDLTRNHARSDAIVTDNVSETPQDIATVLRDLAQRVHDLEWKHTSAIKALERIHRSITRDLAARSPIPGENTAHFLLGYRSQALHSLARDIEAHMKHVEGRPIEQPIAALDMSHD
jgi:hypothetical protein